MKLFELVTAPAIATFWQEQVSNRIPYLGEVLFPARKKLGLDLSWIKGNKGLPITLKPSYFDANPELRDRIGINKLETEMPFFREAMLLKERDRQELLKLQEASSSYYETVIREIFNDKTQLINGAIVSAERMRMQLLLGGKIEVHTDGVRYDYNFDQDGDYESNNCIEMLGSDAWSDHEGSTPITDLMDAIEAVEDRTGTTVTRAIMTRKTWSHLMLNRSIKLDMNLSNGQNIIMTDGALKQYISSKVGLQVQIYNKKYQDEKGVEHAFYPDGYVTLIPDGPIGNTWYGTTPEEADLMGVSGAQVSLVETGIAVTTCVIPKVPVNIETVVSEIVLPSFERMQETYLMKVF